MTPTEEARARQVVRALRQMLPDDGPATRWDRALQAAIDEIADMIATSDSETRAQLAAAEARATAAEQALTLAHQDRAALRGALAAILREWDLLARLWSDGDGLAIDGTAWAAVAAARALVQPHAAGEATRSIPCPAGSHDEAWCLAGSLERTAARPSIRCGHCGYTTAELEARAARAGEA
jgi:hypothetical protein